ncbi:MAG: redoxin domain-containing protein [Brevefilum sp.]|nr:redoxin domain-containing protein [Brevefilum sp.]
MAQLRQDYPQFVERETAVIAVGPDSQQDFIKFWEQGQLPFIGLADPEHVAAKLYDQEVTLLKFGRVPAQMVIDKTGVVRYVHYARSMSDIPENKDILKLLDQINSEERNLENR